MSSDSTLEAFERVLAKVQSRNKTAAQKVFESRTTAMIDLISKISQPRIRSMLATERDTTTKIRELERLNQETLGKLTNKWMGVTVKQGDRKTRLGAGDMPSGSHSSSSYLGNDWFRAAQEQLLQAGQLQGWMPFLAGSRGTVWGAERNKVQVALNMGLEGVATGQNELRFQLNSQATTLCSEISALSGKESVIRVDRPLSENTTTQLALKKLSGGVGEGIPLPLPNVRKGHGRLVFQCGWLAYDMTVRITGGGSWDFRQPPVPVQLVADVGYTPFYVPFLLDLVQDHGFLTTDEIAVKSLVLRMLHALPSGSVTLSVYDPKGMGDFVKYLYPLGDKQEMILGKDGVFSTFKQLQDLLEEVERHVGVINQKYLSGTYKDLVAYNQDAGVTFEPYRVLVINDDPSTWEKKYRQELVEQLTRIADAGPRCGVFVIVCTSAPLDLGLPILVPGQAIAPKYLKNTIAIQPASKPFEPTRELDTTEGKVNCVLAEKVTWLAPDESLIRVEGVREIVQILERELDTARIVEVSPRNVAAIARTYRDAQTAKGVRFGPPIVEFDDPGGWWSESSTDGLFAYVGVDKANQKKPRLLTIRGSSEEFGILIGGQPGSGKSVFLHTLISELIRRYSPDELELYLVDVKFGVEFKHYARAKLPHAKVVALESGAEFAVSVLVALEDEMARRYDLFKLSSVTKIDDYKRKTNQTMPRILAIIDEFSGMFETDSALSDEAKQHLTRLIQQGRAAGVHLVLASQSLSTAAVLPRTVLQQIPQRIVFKVPDQDSRILLADDNPEASHLNRAGEGIFNPHNGRKGANEEFQATLTTPADLKKSLIEVAKLKSARGIVNQPIVLENPGAASWTRETIQIAKTGISGLGLSLPIGLPLSLDSTVNVQLKQTSTGNALVCIENEMANLNVLSAFLLGGALAGAHTVLLDFASSPGSGSSDRAKLEQFLTDKTGKRFTIFRGKNAYIGLKQLGSKADTILAASTPIQRSVIAVVTGLALANELNQVSPESEIFQELLRTGAAAGIHLIVIADSLATIKARFGFSWADPYAVFVSGICGSADSNELVQSTLAANLDNNEQVAVYDRLTGKSQKVRPFKLGSFPMSI